MPVKKLKQKKSKFDRSNLFKFESITIKDDEMVHGKLPGNKVHLATFISFAILELMVFLTHFFVGEFTMAQLITLTVIAVTLARQIAFDFAWHIMLEIYNFPLVIASIFIPYYIFNQGSITQSLIGGVGLFGFFLFFTLLISKIMKKHAGIGGADIIFAFSMGAMLLPEVIFISIFLFSMLSLIITFFYDSKQEVPMGPGLLASFWICLLLQEQMLNLFMKLI